MGITYAKRAWLLCVVVLLLVPKTCSAGTCVELYEVYGKDYEIKYPDNVIETIQSYNYAEKYLAMYYNIAKCEYNTDELHERKKRLKKDIKSVRSQLLAGYYLSIDAIRMLESEYKELSDKLVEVNKSLKTYDLNADAVDVNSVPTKEQYENALNVKSIVDRQAELGNIIPEERPFKGKSLVSDHSKTSITYAVANGTEVTALYHGTVAEISDSTLILDCNNGIIVTYSGIDFPTVNVGDSVKQCSVLAKSKNSVNVKVKIGDDFVDVSKILK